MSASICFCLHAGDLSSIPGSGIPREGNATHPGTLAWKIPWTEKPGRLQSMGWQKSQTRLSNFTFTFFSVMFRFLSLFCMYGCCSVTQSCPTLCDPMD